MPTSRVPASAFSTASALPVEPVAHVLVGALMQGAQVVARATDQAAATVFMAASLHRLLDGLRPAGQ